MISLSNRNKTKTISFIRDNLKVTIFENKIIIGTNLLTPVSIFYLYKKYRILPGHILTDEKVDYYISKAKDSIAKFNEFIYENYKFIENYTIYRYLIILLSGTRKITNDVHLFHTSINVNELNTLKKIKYFTETAEYNNSAYMEMCRISSQILKSLIWNTKFINYVHGSINKPRTYTGIFKYSDTCNTQTFNKSTFDSISSKVYVSEKVISKLNHVPDFDNYEFQFLNLHTNKITNKNKHIYDSMKIFPLKGLGNSLAVKYSNNSLRFYIPSYVSILNENSDCNYYANDDSVINIKESLFNFELFNRTKLRDIIDNLDYKKFEIIRFDDVTIINGNKYYSSFSHYKKRLGPGSHSIKTILSITPYLQLVSNTLINNTSFEIKDLIENNIENINKLKNLIDNFNVPEIINFEDFITNYCNFKKYKKRVYYINANKLNLLETLINNYKQNYPNKEEILELYKRYLFQINSKDHLELIPFLISDKKIQNHFKVTYKFNTNNWTSVLLNLRTLSIRQNSLLLLTSTDNNKIVELNSKLNEILLNNI